MPIETLKIHRSFINDIEHNRDSAELVKAIISMAHSLRLTLVPKVSRRPLSRRS
ncbi:EAL domain-containing protein [Pseudomonas sp. E102]|uniref:EAL domain-containing protein n=1 Tax=Pseudomonas sp. E102 TaxID=181579 RepID=UPI0040454D61